MISKAISMILAHYPKKSIVDSCTEVSSSTMSNSWNHCVILRESSNLENCFDITIAKDIDIEQLDCLLKKSKCKNINMSSKDYLNIDYEQTEVTTIDNII